MGFDGREIISRDTDLVTEVKQRLGGEKRGWQLFLHLNQNVLIPMYLAK